MSTKSRKLTVGGVGVEIVRKNIKNLHLGVYPPHGRVRIAAPLLVKDETVRLAVVAKLAWIKRQREKFLRQPRQSAREMVSGEAHYFLGRRYRLRVREHDGPATVALNGVRGVDIYVRSGSSREQRERVLMRWQRAQLRQLIPPLLDKWQERLRVQAAAWGIKKMKTKWGSCNASSRRIWLNLELIKKSRRCLEYIVVHELLHLSVRHHDREFVDLMNCHLPSWQRIREELNQGPLGHEEWIL